MAVVLDLVSNPRPRHPEKGAQAGFGSSAKA
jgi:hypothetical protein